MPVKISNKELDAVRSESQNSLDLACRLLENRDHFTLVEGIRHCVRPIHFSFGRWLTMSKTQAGMVNLHILWAQGWEQTAHCQECMDTLAGGAGFHRLAFSPQGMQVAESTVKQECAIAQKLFLFCSALCGYRLANKLQHGHSLPGIFALLLHTDELVRNTALEWLERFWNLLLKVEAAAAGHAHAAKFLAALFFPQLSWVRTVLISLAEHSFKAVSPLTREAISSLFRGLLSTNVNECFFNTLRRQESIQRKGVVARKARWHRILNSKLMQENDRHPPPDTPTSLQAALSDKVPNHLFDCDTKDCSLGMEELRTISDDHTWTSFGAEGWRAIPFAVSALLSCGNDWLALHHCWMGQLLRAGNFAIVSSNPFVALSAKAKQ